MKSAAEEATDMVEGTYETAREGAFAFGVKAIDAAKTNSDASFAFAKDLFGAKTFAEVIELNTTYARKQFDAVAGQMKEFQELAQKVVTDATKPVTTQVQKTFKEINARLIADLRRLRVSSNGPAPQRPGRFRVRGN